VFARAQVPQATHSEMTSAVDAAAEAFKTWSKVSVSERQRVMHNYQRLIREHTPELAEMITAEQGKTIADAKGDIFRGLEVVEFACGVAPMMMGETIENVSAGMDTYSYRVPLGVCGGIAPFNFPAMIPLWMYPLAITTGNTFVLKPSERVPTTAQKLVELLEEAGSPPGVVNIVHGSVDTVNFLCDEPRIKALSFVGSNQAGEHIYNRGSQAGKRVQSNMAAKNHAVILPDADKHQVINALVGAAFGAAGQRCMALRCVHSPPRVTRHYELSVGEQAREHWSPPTACPSACMDAPPHAFHAFARRKCMCSLTRTHVHTCAHSLALARALQHSSAGG